jgi:hypothetical protein
LLPFAPVLVRAFFLGSSAIALSDGSAGAGAVVVAALVVGGERVAAAFSRWLRCLGSPPANDADDDDDEESVWSGS